MGWSDSLWTFARDERFMLALIGLATVSIFSTILSSLEVIRDSNEVPPTQPKTQYITQDTEDALELETLERLMEHPTFAIKDIGIRILCDRAVNDPDTMKFLLYGITRPNYDERMKCLRALALLTGPTTGFDRLTMLHTPDAYAAFVRSLELSLGEAERPKMDDLTYDEFYMRDVAERFCLMFVSELVDKYRAVLLVQAGFVKKWLAKQDWGDVREERMQNFELYMSHRHNRVRDIAYRVRETAQGLRALRKAGLLAEEFPSRTGGLEDLVMGVEPESMIGTLADQQLPREREHSAEEQRLRRQHREAMVLNDGSRPFGRDDIIERNQDYAV